ncbi:hypothetical protein MSAN_02063000 [Mycena sanguinolenta]|uniref:Uncharacterized protein n=1 Tax=Mycena sanguinolenta TaxID=230812 RepID=A0A8H7CL49_9AGAR|nr:hypothetical protein MSAN_02063000 [Mycena sanguinolenta]
MHFTNFGKSLLFSITLAVQALATADGVVPVTGFFVPKPSNLIFNTTLPQGVNATLGWLFDSVGDNSNPIAFDGSQKNITILYTPPGGVETFVLNFNVGPGPNGFCGTFPGTTLQEPIDSSVLGTYTGRWLIDWGHSTQPDAPTDPESGCGPLPFTMNNTEFVRTWEVVAA